MRTTLSLLFLLPLCAHATPFVDCALTFVGAGCELIDAPLEVSEGEFVRVAALCESGSCAPTGPRGEHECDSDFVAPDALELRAEGDPSAAFEATDDTCERGGRSHPVYAVVAPEAGAYGVTPLLGGADWGEHLALTVTPAPDDDGQGGCSQTPGGAPPLAVLLLAFGFGRLRRRRSLSTPRA